MRGVVVEEETPSYVHEAALVWLSRMLLPWCRANEARVVGSGLEYALDGDTGRMPDLSVCLRGAPRPPAHGSARTPPGIAVEVVSSTPADAVTATEGTVSVPGCPGLVLDVDALWRELEQAVAGSRS